MQISDYGTDPGGLSYIVMEFLKGETLGQRLEAGPGPLSLAEAVFLARQVADALVAAHEKDIVHRDLKPDNVMIVPDSAMPGGERTKLLDFGIAKLSQGGEQAHLKTNTNAMMGTPAYMSPEQCKGAGHVDAQSDVYSFGVMLFEMLSGQRPFLCQTPGEMISHHLFKPAPPLQSVVRELPRGVTKLVNQLLLKEKAQRPSMRQVVEALDALNLPPPVRRGSAKAAPSKRQPVRTGGVTTLSRLSGQHFGPPDVRTRLVIGAALLGIAFPGSLIAWRLRHPSPPIAIPSRQQTPSPVRQIRLTIQTEPPGAEVFAGELLGHTPWQREQPAATGQLAVQLHLPGYADRLVRLDLSADADLHEVLQAQPIAPPPLQESKNPPLPAKTGRPGAKKSAPAASAATAKPGLPATGSPAIEKPEKPSHARPAIEE